MEVARVIYSLLGKNLEKQTKAIKDAAKTYTETIEDRAEKQTLNKDEN